MPTIKHRSNRPSLFTIRKERLKRELMNKLKIQSNVAEGNMIISKNGFLFE